ncbi:MAG: hypothetical protein D6B27_10205 [Gammaproteobacteria bacterium]|nr:MAG: hypothetical protein D6B27_10205 [Gammaproteobacteria bacterium]
MELASKFELHYYLSDASHSMNALVKNKCETEFLAVTSEVAEILGIHLELDCEALKEGGVREIWKALGDNNPQITLLMAALALIWSVIPQTDNELSDLQKEDLRLSIEERKLEIDKLKQEIEDGVTSEAIEKAAAEALRSCKVATRKSNFYKILSKYEKVTQVGFIELDNENNSLSNEKLVARDKFHSFILRSQDLKPLKNSSARIEIAAPVLTDSKAKWKGFYEDQMISFAMNDQDFKRAVVAKQQSFKNGDEIICVLLIDRKVDEIGEIVTSGYSVDVVLETIHSGVKSKTIQGEQYLKMVEGQRDMFDAEKE